MRKSVRRRTYTAGRLNTSASIFLGGVDVRKKGRRIATLEAGDFAGEIAFLTDAPRTATVSATCPVTALRLTRQGLRRCSRLPPEMRTKVLKALADRLAPSAL